MPPSNTPETRLALLEERQTRADRTLEKLTEGFDRLTRIDMHHAELSKSMASLITELKALDTRIDTRLKEIETEINTRLKPIEQEMPTIKQARDGGFSVAKMIATALVAAAISAGSTLMLQQSHAPAPAAHPAHEIAPK